jgi:probable phosphoglycerate mutase
VSRIIVLRHGQTEWNDEGRFQGSVDVDLNAAGRAQAAQAAKRLADERPTMVVSSDLRRALDTARMVADAAGVGLDTDERLRERAYGPWEGLTRRQIAERYPATFERWNKQLPFALAGIEAPTRVARRTVEALRDVADRVGDGTAVVVTHGGASRQGIAAFLGWEQGQASTVSGLGNCHWADLKRDASGWRMHGYNLSAENS